VRVGVARGGFELALRRIRLTEAQILLDRQRAVNSAVIRHIAEPELRPAREAIVIRAGMPFALIGRSFGGRMCAFLAAEEPPDALVILGHPISPPGQPRPADEAALLGIACPTLVVQGDRDELGPLAVLERIAGQNPRIDLVVLRGAAHEYGAHEADAIDAAARWLGSVLRA